MTVGLQHSAYTFASLEGLPTTYEDLKSAGIEPHVPVQHGPTTSLFGYPAWKANLNRWAAVARRS